MNAEEIPAVCFLSCRHHQLSWRSYEYVSGKISSFRSDLQPNLRFNSIVELETLLELTAL